MMMMMMMALMMTLRTIVEDKQEAKHLNRAIIFKVPDLKHYRLPNTIHLILRITSAYVDETSITRPHPDDHTIRTTRDEIFLFKYILFVIRSSERQLMAIFECLWCTRSHEDKEVLLWWTSIIYTQIATVGILFIIHWRFTLIDSEVTLYPCSCVLEICHLRFILWPLSRLFQLAHTRIHWKIKRNMTFLCILWEKRGKKTTVYIHVVDYLGARVNMYMRMGVTSRALYRRRYLWTCCHFSNWDSRLTYNVTDFEFEKNNRHTF